MSVLCKTNNWKCSRCYQIFTTRTELHCSAHQICKGCISGRTYPIHTHPLVPSRSKNVVNNNNSNNNGCRNSVWKCRLCNKKFEGGLLWHCSKCNFDFCEECTVDGIYSPTHHQHALKYDDSAPRMQWKCSTCNEGYGDQIGEMPYRCHRCDFNMCQKCEQTKIIFRDEVP